MTAFSQVFVNIEDHDMTIVEADGTYTVPTNASSLYIATAQRYGVLVKAKSTTNKNFAILASLDTSAFDSLPSYLQPNVTGVLVYNKAAPIPKEAPPVQQFNLVDDFTLVPVDHEPILTGKPSTSITLDLNFFTQFQENR
jgi:iron transport multicopper oxidase